MKQFTIIEYSDDFANLYTAHTLVSKEYVDNLAEQVEQEAIEAESQLALEIANLVTVTNGLEAEIEQLGEQKQDALGFTPENPANKNQANGYAGLDSTGKVAAAQLPSYVDDVIEVGTFADLSATGESGKIYVTDTPYTHNGVTSSQFRWGGSAYAAIVASPGSTDSVTEGTTNLYFTAARILATLATGLAAVTGTPAATDTLLQLLGKVLNFINTIDATVRAVTLTGLSVASSADITSADSIVSSIGKAQAKFTANAAAITTNTNNIATNAATLATAPRVLFRSVTPITLTGTTSLTQLVNYTLQGGTMGSNSAIRIDFQFEVNGTVGTSNKALSLLWGGLSGKSYYSYSQATQIGCARAYTIIQNVTASSQTGAPGAGWGMQSTAAVNSALNTTQNIDLTFTGQLTNTSDILILRNFTITLIP